LPDYYPDAKVLLTVRDSDSWYNSIANTILKVLEKLTDPNSIGLKMINDRVFYGRLNDHNYAIDLCEKHNAVVRDAISSDRLLEYNQGDSWYPLSQFLSRPIPAEPYPQSNDGEEFHTFFDKRWEPD
jgi:hypothetical protein